MVKEYNNFTLNVFAQYMITSSEMYYVYLK